MRGPLPAWRDHLDIVTLWGFAVAQPLYDLLGRQPTFLVAHRVTAAALAGLVLSLSLALPLLLVAIEALAGALSTRLRAALHLGLVALLAALVALPPLARAALAPAAVPLAVAAACGLAFAQVYARWQPLRLFVGILAPAILVFPLRFAFTPAGKVALPGGAALGGAAGGSPAPVVLVVFDELSLPSLLDKRGGIDAVRFPNFARLARSSWWFPNATATSHVTERAVPAILTGRYPPRGPAVPTARQFPQNLFTWLGGRREVEAVEVLTALCPPALCRPDPAAEPPAAARARELAADLAVVYLHQIAPKELARRALPSLDGRWRGFTRESPGQGAARRDDAWQRFQSHVQSDRGRPFLAAAARAGRPRSLTFIHSLLPHIPWEYLPSGRRYTFQAGDLPPGVVDEVWLDEPQLVRAGYHRYLLQLAFADRLLGRLLDDLQAAHRYDGSLLVVTADHGVCFQPGEPRRTLSAHNLPELVRVPLFVKLPGQRTGRSSERLASGVDILPTIAGVLGLALPWRSDGAPLLAARFPARPRVRVNDRYLDPAAVLSPTPSWQRDAFPRGVPPARLVPAGPHYDDLAGKLLRDLRVRGAGGPREPRGPREPHGPVLRSSDVLLLDGAEPLPDFVPASLRGEILADGSHAGPLTVAVAVNDRVQATVATFPWQGMEHYVSLVLPEAAFDRSRNVVRLFLVEEDGGELSLIPVPWERSASYRVVADARGDRLVDRDGRELQISPPAFALAYSLDRHYARSGVVGFVGWAGDLSSRRPPSRIVVALEGAGLIVASPNVERPDVATRYGGTLLPSGYSFELPEEPFLAALARDPGLAGLRFFALFSGRAVELQIPSNVKQELAAALRGTALRRPWHGPRDSDRNEGNSWSVSGPSSPSIESRR